MSPAARIPWPRARSRSRPAKPGAWRDRVGAPRPRAPGPLARPGGPAPKAREQLGEGKRLGQVVVGAAVQAGDAVLERATGGQHQHRRPDSLAREAAGRPRSRRCPAGSRRARSRRRARACHPDRVLSGPRDVDRSPSSLSPRRIRPPSSPRPRRPARASPHCRREDESQMRPALTADSSAPPTLKLTRRQGGKSMTWSSGTRKTGLVAVVAVAVAALVGPPRSPRAATTAPGRRSPARRSTKASRPRRLPQPAAARVPAPRSATRRATTRSR